MSEGGEANPNNVPNVEVSPEEYDDEESSESSVDSAVPSSSEVNPAMTPEKFNALPTEEKQRVVEQMQEYAQQQQARAIVQEEMSQPQPVNVPEATQIKPEVPVVATPIPKKENLLGRLFSKLRSLIKFLTGV